MKHNTFLFFKIIALLFAIYVPKYSHCQYDLYRKVSQGAEDALIEYRKDRSEKTTNRERSEARQEAERQRQIRNDLRNCPNLINHINNPDYRWMILHESEFLEPLKEQLFYCKDIVNYFMLDNDLHSIILADNALLERLKKRIVENSDRILEYMDNADLKKIILSDSELISIYIKHDIKSYPNKLSNYINDPNFKKLYDSDPELKDLVADNFAKKIIAEQKAEEEKIRQEKENAERIERCYQAEQRRLEEERQRAIEQERLNEQKKQTAIDDSRKLNSMIVPRHDEGINKNNDVKDDLDAFEVLYDDPAIKTAIKSNAVYSSQNGLNKALEDAGTRAKIELKKKQKEWQGMVVSIPIGKANAFMEKTLETAYPGTRMWQKVKVSQIVRHDEEELISNTLKCLAKEGTEAVSSGDMKKLYKCVTQAKDAFLDKMGEHIADLTHTKNFRKIYKWFTQKDKKDEEY